MTDSASTPLTLPPGSLPRLPAAKSLFSLHYLQTRLPEHAEWAADPLPAFEAVRRLWERAHALGGSWNEAQTEQEFVKPVLDALGWSYIVQAKAQRRGGSLTRPDYALFPSQVAADEAYPHQRTDDAFYGHVVGDRRGQVLGTAAEPAGQLRPQHLEGREQPQPPDGQLPGGHALPVGHPHQRPYLAPLQPGGQQHRQRVLRGRSRCRFFLPPRRGD